MKRKSLIIMGKNLLVERRRTKAHGDPGEDEAVISGVGIEVSDGYHRLSEVYQHRMAIFVALLHAYRPDKLRGNAWKSKHHSDCVLNSPSPALFDAEGKALACCSMFEGNFVCGLGFEPGKQITYHLPLEMWDEVRVPEMEKAPSYDGHTSKDVLERLRAL